MNSFYDWLETNTLTDSAIVLWHALMNISYRAGWPDEFAVAISTLSHKTGLKKDAIGAARNRLQQLGRIRFTSRPGQQSAIYCIKPFASVKPTQTTSQHNSGGLTDTNNVTNSAQTPSQSTRKQPPLDLSIDLKELDTETDKDRLLRLFNFHEIEGGAFALAVVNSYLGIVETGVIELAIMISEKKPVKYFQKTIDNWIKEGKTTVDLVMPKPAIGTPSAQSQQNKSVNYSNRSAPGKTRTGKPNLPVVGQPPPDSLSADENEKLMELARRLSEETTTPIRVVTQEERERMRELARKMKEEGHITPVNRRGNDDDLPF